MASPQNDKNNTGHKKEDKGQRHNKQHDLKCINKLTASQEKVVPGFSCFTSALYLSRCMISMMSTQDVCRFGV